VSALAVLTHQRQQQGAASSITRSQRKQAQNKRKRVRQLVAMMQSWQAVDAPSSATVERLPAAWTDSQETLLFKGEYPWRLTAKDSSSAVAAVLAERFRDMCAEVSAGCWYDNQLACERRVCFGCKHIGNPTLHGRLLICGAVEHCC
jgi:hypothetical protein